MGRLRDGWRVYTAYTAKGEMVYMRGMTPGLVIATVVVLVMGEWVAAAILAPAAAVGVADLWRHRRSTSD